MAKKSKKYLEAAACWKISERNNIIALVIGIIIAVGLFIGWNYILINGIMTNSIFVFIFAAFVAFILGLFGNKVAKANRECNKILMEHGYSKQDLKDYMKTSQKSS